MEAQATATVAVAKWAFPAMRVPMQQPQFVQLPAVPTTSAADKAAVTVAAHAVQMPLVAINHI